MLGTGPSGKSEQFAFCMAHGAEVMIGLSEENPCSRMLVGLEVPGAGWGRDERNCGCCARLLWLKSRGAWGSQFSCAPPRLVLPVERPPSSAALLTGQRFGGAAALLRNRVRQGKSGDPCGPVL